MKRAIFNLGLYSARSTRIAPKFARSTSVMVGHESVRNNRSDLFAMGAVAAALGATGFGMISHTESDPSYPNTPLEGNPPEYSYRPDLPTFTYDEVKAHTDTDAMWCTFRGGVYDFTSFTYAHPGGTTRLMMAAGEDLEAFWNVYRQHFRGHVLNFMERKLRVGNVSKADATRLRNESTFDNAYENDPERDSDHLGCMERPWCGEPRIQRLTETFLTPNELFYVRNHLPVPDIDPEEYELVIEGIGVKQHVFNLNDLKTKFRKYEVISTLQCAGNRREDLHGDRGVFISPHWVVGAISCAKWGGARLRDVLEHCGMDVDGMALGKAYIRNANHVQFEGYDCDETGLTYGGSIPIDKAVDALGDCLIAYEMNGEDIPRDHGFPVRALSPGHAGARQCKWLHKVIVAEDESQKPWHQKSYRGFPPDVSFEEDLAHWPTGLRLDQAAIVQEMPTQSLVCNPASNSVVAGKDKTSVTVKGVAWCGGGKGINRVDVSIDGGKHFTAAELDHGPTPQIRNRQWAWTQFEKEVPLSAAQIDDLKKGKQVKLDICSKAVNSSFDSQPERPEPYWNARGVCINHWYHVPVTVDPKVASSSDANLAATEGFGNVPSGGHFQHPWRAHGFDPKAGAGGDKL